MTYIGAIIRRIFCLLKMFILKALYWSKIKFSLNESISLSTSFKIRKKGKIQIGSRISTRKNVEFNANENGTIMIGNGTFFNNNCIVACHEKIEIGKNCSFGPNVVIYDHDHDFRTEGGKKTGEYKTAPVIIGNNVWVGANVIILRGVTIGDNAVIAAGTIVKENVENNVIYHAKIVNESKLY